MLISPGRKEAAAFGFWLVSLKRATLIRNFRETATGVRSFHVDNKTVVYLRAEERLSLLFKFIK